MEHQTIQNRREFLFLYDCRNSNPNGDPDTNRPRLDEESGKINVTDVRLKRFCRDYIIDTKGEDHILVTQVNKKAKTLTARIRDAVEKKGLTFKEKEFQQYLKEAYVDLRWFGSSLALANAPKEWGESRSITGAIQINFGTSLNKVALVEFPGTSIMASDESAKQGTFTEFHGIRYGLIGFHGIINENAAKWTGLTDDDVSLFYQALWKGVRDSSSANTRTKMGQIPHLLISIVYKKDSPYQIGDLDNKVVLRPKEGKIEDEIRTENDYTLDFSPLLESLSLVKSKIETIEYCLSPSLKKTKLIDSIRSANIPTKDMNLDSL